MKLDISQIEANLSYLQVNFIVGHHGHIRYGELNIDYNQLGLNNFINWLEQQIKDIAFSDSCFNTKVFFAELEEISMNGEVLKNGEHFIGFVNDLYNLEYIELFKSEKNKHYKLFEHMKEQAKFID